MKILKLIIVLFALYLLPDAICLVSDIASNYIRDARSGAIAIAGCVFFVASLPFVAQIYLKIRRMK